MASGAWADLKNVALSRDLSTLLLIFLETPLVFVRRSVPFSLEESIVVTFAENWSQSKYVVSDPRTVWPECVYNPRDLCVFDPRDLLLECVSGLVA